MSTMAKRTRAGSEHSSRLVEGSDMARLLVIEDQKKLLNSLQRGLEEEGYEVVAAATGEQGYYAATTEPVRRHRPRPDAARARRAASAPRPAEPTASPSRS